MPTPKRPFRLGLQARITALTAIVLVAMFVAMGIIGLRDQAASMDVVLQQRVALAETVAAQVDYNIGHMLAEMTAAAAEPGFDLSDADLAPEQAALADLFRSGMFTYDVFVTDARGVVLAVEPEALRADLVGVDLSQHSHVRRALETGQPQVSGVISGVAVSGPLVSLVVPLKNANGEITGLIGGALDPGGPAISGFIAPMALGETGYAQVIDGQGMVVASTHPGRAGTPGEHRDLILSLLQRGEPTVSPDSPVTEEGKAFHEVIAFAPLPRLGWGVTVEQDRAEALAAVIRLRNQIMVATIIALVVATFFVWFTTRQVTRPVLTIAEAARRVTEGDLSTPLPEFGRDEVGQLGRDFEAMRGKLAAWGEELEAAVQKRTRQLSVLYAIDRAAAQSLELGEILNDALDRVLEVLEVEAGGIFLLEPDGKTMTLRVHRGLSDEFVENIRRIRLGEGISGRAAAERQPVVLDVPDYPTERLAPLIVREGFQTLASTPLLSAGELVGALNVGTRRPRAFPPEEMELLTAIGRQLGGAVSNARLHQETRQRAERLSILNHIAHALAATLNLDELLEIVHREIMAAVQADAFFIALYDGEANELDFRIRIDKGVREPPERRPVTPGLTAAVVTGKQPLLIRDFEREKDHLPPVKLWGTMEAPQSWLSLPLLLGQDVIGVISVQAYRTGAFDENDQQLLSTIADAVAVAVENARLYAQAQENQAQLRRQFEQVQSVYHLSEAVSRAEALEEICEEALDSLQRTLNPDRAAILLLDAEGVMRFKSSRSLSEGYQKAVEGHSPWSPDETNPQPVLVSDVEVEPSLEALRAAIRAEGLRALAFIPLTQQGRLLGKFMVYYDAPHAFRDEEVQLVQTIAHEVAFAIERRRAEQSLRASEQEYRTLVENATELIWTLDREGRFTFVNRQAEVVSGQKLEDWLGKSFASLIAPPEDLPRIQRVFLKTLAGAPQNYEVGVYRPDGSIFYLSVNTTPLYRDGQVIGVISFGRDVSVQQEAEAALTQRMAELSSLFEVSSTLRGVEGVERMLPVIVDKAVESCRADCGNVLLLDESGELLVCRYGTGARQALVGARLRLDQGISGRVAQSGAAHLSPDFQHDPLLAFGPATSARLPEIASDVCVPLRVGEQIVGAMHVSTYTPRTCTEAELRLLTAIADMAASAIRRAGLLEQLEHRVHELSALFDVGKMATASLHIEDVLQFVAGAVTEAVHAEGSYVFLWDERVERLALRASQGFLAEDVGRMKFRPGEGLGGWVFLEGRTVNAPDLAADPRWKRDPHHEAPLPSGQANNALVVPLVAGKKTLGVLGVINKIGAPAFTASDESLLSTLAGQVAIAIENARLYEDVRGLSVAAIRSLATAIDARDPYTSGHSEDVAHLAVQLARELGWSGADLEMLEFAALLHDVGKIAVPDAILQKAKPLTPDEWNIIRLHPYHSAQIVKPIEPLQRIVPWVYHHQERWDGTGYPDGLKGEAIPLASRIIAVVDAFNAMTTDRPYRKGRSVAEALAEIKRCAGKQFDPAVAAAFLKVVSRE